MSEVTRILFVEDSESDAGLAEHVIRQLVDSCEFQRVDTRENYLAMLESYNPDLIISDYTMPRFDGMTALQLALQRSPLTPVIIWTGSINEDTAVNCMKAGANNYVLKDNLKRLGPAVLHALEEKKILLERKQAEDKLRESEDRYRGLFENMVEGFAYCQMIFEDGQPKDWIYLAVNGAFEVLTGLKNITGKRVSEVIPGIRETDSQLFEMYARVSLSGKPEKFETFVEALRMWFSVSVYSHEKGFFVAMFDVITARKQAEEKIRKSEERLAAVMEGSQLGYSDWNIQSGEVQRNEHWASMLGYTLQEIETSYDQWEELIHPDDRARAKQTVQDHLDGKTPIHRDEYRLRAKDGSYRWILDQGKIIEYDAQGRPLRMTATHTDVTERKQAEEALKRSESFTKSIIENEPECVKIVEADGILQYMNPAGLAMIEADDLDLVAGKSVYPIVAAEHRKAFVELTEKVLRGEQETLQFEIIGLKGTRRWLDTHAVPLLDEQGNVKALLGLTRDITERKQAEQAARVAEEKYRGIFENAIEGIYQSVPGGRFLTVNPAFARMVGYGSPQEMIAAITNIADQVYVETPRRAEFMKLMADHGRISAFEYQIRRKDQGILWVSENARTVRDDEGNILYYEGIIEDITERKRAEQRIQNQLKRLNALHHIDNAIKSNVDLRNTLEVLLEQVTAQLNVDAASVLLFNKNTFTLDYTASRGFRSTATQYTKLQPGEGYAGRVIMDRLTIHIPDLAKTEGKLATALSVAGENFTAYIGVPLIAKGQVVGVLEIFQRLSLTPDHEWFDYLETLAGQAAIAIDNAQLFENLQRSNFELTLSYDATIEGWSRAMGLRDEETEGHTQRVTALTLKLARQMGIPEAEILHIRRGALLHDIGKMGIPDSILLKPDALTDEERTIMRRHPTYAYEMLRPVPYLKPALDIPYSHHEKWDGTGYPQGLKGEQIPLPARIFAIVDVWDALTSNRPYRKAWSKRKAMEFIKSESGKHFDPQVAKTFLTLTSAG